MITANKFANFLSDRNKANIIQKFIGKHMSEMELFYGVIEKSDLNIDIEDTDDFYELEEQLNCHFVKVNNQLYSFYAIEDHDPYGFSMIIPSSDKHHILCYWYNGGAGIHEVVENCVKRYLENNTI